MSGQQGGFAVVNNRQLGIVIANNWLWNRGRHNFNFGGQFRRTYQDLFACQFCAGSFAFSQRTTSTPDTSDPNFGVSGSSFASFLLGEVDASVRLSSNVTRLRNKEFAFYVQDDIKVNPRLTANIGLRWDIMVPFTENSNNIVYVNFRILRSLIRARATCQAAQANMATVLDAPESPVQPFIGRTFSPDWASPIS